MDVNIIQKTIDENLLPKIIKIDETINQATYYETDDYNKYIILHFKDKLPFPVHITDDLGTYESIERKVIKTLSYIK